MTPDPTPPAAVLRVRSPGLRQAVVVLVLSVLATVGAALDHQAVAAPLLAVFTLLVVGLVVQTAVAQVRASADGLTSRSPWRRPRRLTWAEVDGFGVRGFWRVLGAWTADGRWSRSCPTPRSSRRRTTHATGWRCTAAFSSPARVGNEHRGGQGATGPRWSEPRTRVGARRDPCCALKVRNGRFSSNQGFRA